MLLTPQAETSRSSAGLLVPQNVQSFRYTGYEFHASSGVLRCSYALDDVVFEEQITFAASRSADVDQVAVGEALWLVYLLAGVSYYKAAAPPQIVVEQRGLTPAARRLLEAFYLDGLGEYAYRNDLDLSGVEIVAEDLAPVVQRAGSAPGRVLVPFGGGVDSIVTVEGLRDNDADMALFVVSREGDRFDAIEAAAEVTGLEVVRAERRLDDKILRSSELGYRNGHVPVTGLLSAIAVTAALLDGRDAVAMSNEWSASSGNVQRGDRVVNHQWSKSLEFEDLFRVAVAESISTPVEYFSWLRPFSELWVAERFAELDSYHPVFRSCNRAFHIDRALRLDHWCGRCDKCCFIDLILAPFVERQHLADIFGGTEPLDDPELAPAFRTLLGLSGDIKPFECVGDVDECRVSLLLASARADRADAPWVAQLADEVRRLVPGDPAVHAARLARPLGPHRVPDRYAPSDLLV